MKNKNLFPEFSWKLFWEKYLWNTFFPSLKKHVTRENWDKLVVYFQVLNDEIDQNTSFSTCCIFILLCWTGLDQFLTTATCTITSVLSKKLSHFDTYFFELWTRLFPNGVLSICSPVGLCFDFDRYNRNRYSRITQPW